MPIQTFDHAYVHALRFLAWAMSGATALARNPNAKLRR